MQLSTYCVIFGISKYNNMITTLMNLLKSEKSTISVDLKTQKVFVEYQDEDLYIGLENTCVHGDYDIKVWNQKTNTEIKVDGKDLDKMANFIYEYATNEINNN